MNRPSSNRTSSSAAMDFLAALPADRRAAMETVRDTILRNLPAGYEEAMAGDVLAYQVPLAIYPDTYNGHPLWYVALASQKHHLSLYLMSAYGDARHLRRLQEGSKAAGKKLDMGKACIRFRQADDLALELIGELVASIPMDQWVAMARSVRARAR